MSGSRKKRRSWMVAAAAAGAGLTMLTATLNGATTASAATPDVVDTGGTVLPGRAAGRTGTLGVTFGYDQNTLSGNYNYTANTHYNIPMYKASLSDPTGFWDNYVEELLTAGVDYVAMDIRGFTPGSAQPDQAGDPRYLTGLVDAINRLGAGDRLKIAAFDDTAASLTDRKNQVVHHTGGGTPPFDIGDAAGTGEGGYQYFWENNERAYFQAVPDNLRFKINGRPVVYEWSVTDPFFTNQGNGNLANMLNYGRSHAESEFGVNPFYILDDSWKRLDPTVQQDGSDGWFGLTNPSTLDTTNGMKFGAAVPGFSVVMDTTNMVIDPNHGQTLSQDMENTVNSGADTTLVEGFTDWQENALLGREADGTYDQRHVDYPNQMLNILRRYSRSPFPDTVQIQAETADSYSDATPGNVFNTYRDGDLDVQATGDTGGGWNVGSIDDNEWLQWQQIGMQGRENLKVRVATPNNGAQLRFVIDGVAGPTVGLPNTGGWQTYQTVDAGTFDFAPGTYHTVRIEFPKGQFNLNSWTGQSLATGPTGPITGIAGKCVDDTAMGTANGTAIELYDCNGTSAQQWTVQNDGTLRIYGKCMDVTGGATTNGTQVELYDCNGGGSQQWAYDTATGTLINPPSGRCLDATGGGSANGTRLEIWDCNGGANQKWNLPTA
ncbi:DUF5010 domain-containing protein [Streptomyces sp. NPDC002513]